MSIPEIDESRYAARQAYENELWEAWLDANWDRLVAEARARWRAENDDEPTQKWVDVEALEAGRREWVEG